VVHSFLDGTAIGTAYQTNTSLAVTVAIGVVAHGFNTYTLTSLYGNARPRALTLLTLDALAPIAGATLTTLQTIPNNALAAYLGLFAGFLLYLATSDILPEAHTPRRVTGWTLSVTVLGTVFMWGVIGLTD
jgi:zinc transporter ZupT